MKQKVDSAFGRMIYSRRMGTVEAVFGQLDIMILKHFSLRGTIKVNCQWQLVCLVHNLKRVHHFRVSSI